jgi:hypothetical protein
MVRRVTSRRLLIVLRTVLIVVVLGQMIQLAARLVAHGDWLLLAGIVVLIAAATAFTLWWVEHWRNDDTDG